MRRLLAAIAALGLCGPATAQLTISGLAHFTENRGWNEAGIGPVYQTVVTATVVPSGAHTLVFADNGGAPEPLVHFPYPGSPDLYVYWRRFDTSYRGAWRVRAERGDEKSAPVWSPPLAKPQQIPLMQKVEVRRRGAQTQVRWVLPALAGFDVDRIRVAIRGGQRVSGRFLSVLYTSDPLPPGATTFTVPPGLLAAGERYIFEVALEDLEAGALQNRSLTYSAPYVVPR
jgi:hypothetical protein